MTTIVMNTLNAAVTEYGWTFKAITQSYAAGPNLYTLGGNLDVAAAITGEIRTGTTLLGDSARKGVEDVFISLTSTGTGICVVEGEAGVFEYSFDVRDGVSRAVPGKGISENSLAFGYRNVGGVDFRLDRIEPSIVKSQTRRIG